MTRKKKAFKTERTFDIEERRRSAAKHATEEGDSDRYAYYAVKHKLRY